MPPKGYRKPFDWELLDKVLQYKPSLSDTAEIMKVSEDTVENRIKELHGVTFSEYRNKKMANVRLTLVQKAIQMANTGDRTMLIFCLKNYCGWQDAIKQEMEGSNLHVEYRITKTEEQYGR